MLQVRGMAQNHRGALLVETLIGIAIFSIFAGGLFLTLITGQQSTQTGSDRVRGVYYTEQALEIAKSVRDGDFTDLVNGAHGFDLTETGAWVLTGALVDRYDYVTTLNITEPQTDVKRLIAVSTWKRGVNRSGATALSLELTNWRESTPMGNWASVTPHSLTPSGTPAFSDVVASGDYAYATGGSAGRGIYVFDVSNSAAPTQVSTSLDITGQTHKPVIYGNTLYIAVENGSGPEIQAFDITNPVTAFGSSAAPIATYNVPSATNRVVSLAIKDAILFAGTKSHNSEPELYAFDISNPAAITLLGSFETGSRINDIYVAGSYAYLATDSDTAEMLVLNITNPATITNAGAMNISSDQDGYAAKTFGTGFYLGRAAGSSIDEFVLKTGSGGLPGSGSERGFNLGGAGWNMAIDPLGCYAFMATDFATAELRILNLRSANLASVATYNTTLAGKGIYYNLYRDVLYMVTDGEFYTFTPGASTGSCT